MINLKRQEALRNEVDQIYDILTLSVKDNIKYCSTFFNFETRVFPVPTDQKRLTSIYEICDFQISKIPNLKGF